MADNLEDFVAKSISDVVNALLATGLADERSITSCSTQEIADVANDCEGPLPLQYEEFLATMGRGAGRLLVGTDFFYPSILGLARDGRELLNENDATDLMEAGSVIVGMHQGYELYWIEPAGRTCWYKEGGDSVYRTWPTFFDFLATQVEAEANVGNS